MHFVYGIALNTIFPLFENESLQKCVEYNDKNMIRNLIARKMIGLDGIIIVGYC